VFKQIPAIEDRRLGQFLTGDSVKNSPALTIIFGTRPEAIKMAPLIKIFRKNKKVEIKIIVTAQHREMLDQILTLFKIQPDYDLDIMRSGQSLTTITTKILLGIEEILRIEKPDLVLVHGDTSTTFACSFAAFYQQIPIGHVEAGLRTFNKYSPFPEEINRRLTACLSDLHFAPTETAKQNLIQEGINPQNIYVTGNTVIDALYDTVNNNYQFKDALLNQLFDSQQKIILLTTHRRENLGKPMESIFLAIRDILIANEDVRVLFPIHYNPLIRNLAKTIFEDLEGIYIIEPLDYEPFVNVMSKCINFRRKQLIALP